MQNYSKKLANISKFAERTQDAKNLKDVNILVNHAERHNNEDKANSGYRADHVATEILQETTKKLIAQSTAYRESYAEMLGLQADLIENAKKLTKETKDYANQVGESFARIDKILVKDFDIKLNMLERFVIALKEIDQLQKNGALEKIKQSFIS